jgi:hypothetical protein
MNLHFVCLSISNRQSCQLENQNIKQEIFIRKNRKYRKFFQENTKTLEIFIEKFEKSGTLFEKIGNFLKKLEFLK